MHIFQQSTTYTVYQLKFLLYRKIIYFKMPKDLSAPSRS
jgi:hypothetical protein